MSPQTDVYYTLQLMRNVMEENGKIYLFILK